MNDPFQAATPAAASPVLVGELMSMAARLGLHARDGEILITDATYRMVRGAAEVEKLESPIDLRAGGLPVGRARLAAS